MKNFFVKLLLFFNILLVFVLLLSYLSLFVSPESIWIPAFLGLAYPFLFFFNLLFVIAWLALKKRLFLISLAAIMLGWGILSRTIQIAPREKNFEEEEEITPVKVLTYNVRAFNQYKWLKNDEAGDNIFKFITESRADIICIQEFALDEASRLMKIYSSSNNAHIHNISHNKKRIFGLATLTSHPILQKGSVFKENISNGCIYTDVLIKKDTVRIYNSHLQSIHLGKTAYVFLDSVSFISDEKQVREIKEISIKFKDAYIERAKQAKLISEHINKSPYPVIVCGDFNDTPVSYTYQRIKGIYLQDAFREAGAGICNTYAGGKIPTFRIDYILHDKSFKPFNFKRHKVYYSDHYPLTVDFVIEKNVPQN